MADKFIIRNKISGAVLDGCPTSDQARTLLAYHTEQGQVGLAIESYNPITGQYETYSLTKAEEHRQRIGLKIVMLRKRHHISQASLAELSGVHRANLSLIENGITSATADTLSAIADALGAHLDIVEDT